MLSRCEPCIRSQVRPSRGPYQVTSATVQTPLSGHKCDRPDAPIRSQVRPSYAACRRYPWFRRCAWAIGKLPTLLCISCHHACGNSRCSHSQTQRVMSAACRRYPWFRRCARAIGKLPDILTCRIHAIVLAEKAGAVAFKHKEQICVSRIAK